MGGDSALLIERARADDARDLGRLLPAAVAEGFSLEFVHPPREAEAIAWWSARLGHPATVVLIARFGAELAGTVTLALAAQENAAHRAEVKKLIVPMALRRRGIARELMAHIEAEAVALGRTLIVLDTVPGGGADAFYRRTGYVEAGVIPGFAAGPGDGDLLPTMLFYKPLAG